MNRQLDLPTEQIANVAQAVAWNGAEGANWAEQSTRRIADGDLVEDLLAVADVAPGERVLDIGCGTGELTRRVARLAVGGSALGVDLSELMVTQARTEAAAQHLDNVSFETADVQTYPFEPGGFDVALSHFGAMFFDEPAAAFANVARSLRPGGRLAFVCPAAMDRCDWYMVPLSALYGHRPTSEEAPSMMFSLANPAATREILTAAGFTNVTIESLDVPLWFGRDARTAATTFLRSGPVRAFLERSPTVSATVAHAALERAVAPYLGPDGIRIPGAHWMIRARRPEGGAGSNAT